MTTASCGLRHAFWRAIFLLSLATFLPATPCQAQWWKGSTFYEIFVRSFQDSDGDGKGDLKGIASRLNYLNEGSDSASLGVRGIWLTPIFPSPTYHGYDATDFYSVNPDFGNLDDFHNLVRKAHEHGIKVILDMSVNYTSDEHPWFQDALSSPNALHRDWYVFRDQRPNWGKWYPAGKAYYYSVFDRSMPQLNWKNPKVMAAMKDVFRFWMKQGADGFRLDAARYYIPGPHGEADTAATHQVIADFTGAIRAEFPNVLFVGEVWTDEETINSYCENGDELDLAFNFPLAFSLISTLQKEDPAPFTQALKDYEDNFSDLSCSAPILTNHDMDRLATQLGNDSAKLQLAAEMYLMLPGTPFVYYGEELGFPNGEGKGDWPKRLPMQWNESSGFGFTEEDVDPWAPFLGEGDIYSVEAQDTSGSLLSLYRKLIHFRNRTPALALGDISDVQSLSDQPVILWKRHYNDQTAVVVVNLSEIPSDPFPLDRGLLRPYGLATTDARFVVPSLPPLSSQVFLMR